MNAEYRFNAGGGCVVCLRGEVNSVVVKSLFDPSGHA